MNGKRYTLIVLLIVFILMFFTAFNLLNNRIVNAVANEIDDLLLDADLVNITMGDNTTNGVTGVEFGICTNEDLNDDSFGIFSGNDGQTKLMATTQGFKDDQAIVYCFNPVVSSDYDYMEMRIALCNWDEEYDRTFYFFKSGESDLSIENAIRGVDVKSFTTGERILLFSINEIKDVNGNVSNITILKTCEDWRSEHKGDAVCLDYIKFSKKSVLDENQLSNCKEDNMQALFDDDFEKCILKDSWSSTNHERSILGDCGFKSGISGSIDGNVYKFAWNDEKGLLYPAVFFSFSNKCSFDISSNLNVRLYVDSNANDDAELWFTSANAENPFEAARKVTIGNIRKGEWITISLRAKDFVVDGEIGDICIVMHMNDNIEFTPNASFIYFDDFSYVLVEKVVAPSTSYKHYDISEVLPIGELGYSTEGEWEDFNKPFDFTKFSNVPFIRKDIELSSVKFNMKINDLTNDFDFYFLLRGVDNYYIKGGIYYWFSNNGLSIGISGMNPIKKSYSEVGIESDKFFKVEFGAVPYRVDGIVSGYYGYLKINDEEILSDYFDNGSVSFGKYFGLLMNTTTSKTKVTLEPIDVNKGSVVKPQLTAPDGEEEINIGDYVRFIQKVECNFVGQIISEVKLVSGKDLAEIDEDGYLVAKKGGIVKVAFTVKNDFGEYSSNELTFKILGGSNEKNCKSSVWNGAVYCAICLFVFCYIMIKDKKREKKL